MNTRFIVSVVVMFVVTMLLGFVVHGALLHNEYAKLVPSLFRSPESAQAYFPYMLAGHVFIAIGLTWAYRAGRDSRPWMGQGLRFGVMLAVLVTIPNYLIYYAVQPMPSDLVALQIAYDSIAMVLIGLAVAAVNRDPAAARA